jgi:WD40 repeat protein
MLQTVKETNMNNYRKLAISLSAVSLVLLLCLSWMNVQGQHPPYFEDQVDWSNDGSRIVLGNGRGVFLYTADLQTHRQLTSSSAYQVAWQPGSNRYLAVAHGDNRLAIWDVEATQIISEIPQERLSNIEWKFDGSQLAGAGRDRTVKIWDLNLNLVKTIPVTSEEESTRFIEKVLWSPDGQKLAISIPSGRVNERNVYIIDAQTDQFSFAFERDDPIQQWSPDGRYILTLRPELVDVVTGEYVTGYFACAASGNFSLAMSPDGRRAAGSGAGSGCLIFLDEVYQQIDWKLSYGSPASDIAWHPDGSRFVITTLGGWLDMVDANTGNLLFTGTYFGANLSVLEYYAERSCVSPGLADYLLDRIAANDLASLQTVLPTQVALGFLDSSCLDEMQAIISYFLVHPTPTPDLRTPQLPSIQAACSDDPTNYRVWRVFNPNWFDVALEVHWHKPEETGWQPSQEIVLAVARDGVPSETVVKLSYDDSNRTLTAGNFIFGSQVVVVESSAAPCSTPTPTATPTLPPTDLRALYAAYNSAPVTPVLHPSVVIRNDGNTPVPLSEVRLRYYFTRDGSADLQASCTFIPYYPSGVLPDIIPEPQPCASSVIVETGALTAPTATADSYLELRFTDGTLPANGYTVQYILSVNKADWSAFQQTNDYSFSAFGTYPLPVWDKITLTRQGVAVWGVAPR